MARTNLTPEQDLLVREAYQELVVNASESIYEGAPSTRRTLQRELLGLLNYVIIGGKFVDAERWKKHTFRFGDRRDEGFECEWMEDEERNRELAYEAAQEDQGSYKADSGESP